MQRGQEAWFDDRGGLRYRQVVRNHYFAWLYEFKASNPNTSIRTAYDDQVVAPEGNDQGDEQLLQQFCGDLTFVEVSVPTQHLNDESTDPNPDGEDTGGSNEEHQETAPAGEFKLLLEDGETADAYKEARDHDQQILKGIQERIDLDQQGSADGSSSLKSHFSKMGAKLAEDSQAVAETDLRGRRKQKRKSKGSLTDFTSSTKKSKKGSDEIKGWTKAGKEYVVEMLGAIKRDEDAGIRKKWDSMYKTLCEAVKEREDKDEEEDEDEQHFQVDPNVLYAEVLSVSV